MKAKCTIKGSNLHSHKRIDQKDSIIKKDDNKLQIVFNQDDTLDDFEFFLNQLCGNSSFLYNMKKKVSSYLLSLISVVVLLFALISSSLYEDIMKKIILEIPFEWSTQDTIALFFVLIFFIGLILMPSLLEGEGSEFKQSLKSWVNKDIRVLKRLKIALRSFDKDMVVNIYNVDYLSPKNWIWRLVIPIILNHFKNVNFYVRNDLKKKIGKRLKSLGCETPQIEDNKIEIDSPFNYNLLFSEKEEILFTLLQLSSTNILNKKDQNIYVSLELFEYCGRNFYDQKDEKNGLISGFQNFVNRCFDDFHILEQHKSNQVFLKKYVKLKDLEDEKRRLSYYLRNHIEECLEYFDNSISLLILYYYVKDIVLDEKRIIIILEKLVLKIKEKQQYLILENYWFDIAGEMFDSSNLDSFITTKHSIYRKLSIETLDNLMFLFERGGMFKQSLLIARYLYSLNPNRYSIEISSLYERMGNFDKAYNSLIYNVNSGKEPNELEIRFYQRKAWIIVSQRKEERKSEGLKILEKLKDLLFLHSSSNKPIWLWHYYNIKANYEEWNKNYDLAIENYMRCLSVPALGSFEYGATFVNMAIAYRFKFLLIEQKDEKLIDRSIYLGDIGIKLKESVGDRDEMPVVLHNQTLNILYKIIFFEDDKLLDRSFSLCSKALDILSYTNSNKRLGMLLMEMIIIKTIKGEDIDTFHKKLELNWINIDMYEKEQVIKLYQFFRKKCKIKEINFIR